MPDEVARRRRFEDLFGEFYEPVLAYALRRVDRELARDVVSETFAAAWRRLDLIPVDPMPWLLATARRVISNQLRSQQRKQRLADRLRVEMSDTEPSTPDLGDRVSEQHEMLSALERLTDEDREALMLVSWEGLSNDRAAQVLGMSREAFDSRLSRARRRLANEIAILEGRAVHRDEPRERRRVEPSARTS